MIEIEGEFSPTPVVTARIGHALTTLTLETETNSQTITVETPEGRMSLIIATSETTASITLAMGSTTYIDTTQTKLKKALQALGDQMKLSAIINEVLPG